MGGCRGLATSFFLLPPSWKLFVVSFSEGQTFFIVPRAISAGRDPLGETRFGQKQKETLAGVSNSGSLWGVAEGQERAPVKRGNTAPFSFPERTLAEMFTLSPANWAALRPGWEPGSRVRAWLAAVGHVRLKHSSHL